MSNSQHTPVHTPHAPRTRALIAIAALLAVPTLAAAQGPGGILPTPDDAPNRQGTRGANFLHLGVGARGGAMAGSVVSTVDGPIAWFWNPAGASTSEGFSAVAGRHDLYGSLGITQHYAAASLPLLGGVVGAHLNTLNSGEMTRTTEANPFGERLGGNTFQWTSTVFGLGYARRLTDRLAVGAQVKYIREGIPEVGTAWIAADVGTQFNTGLLGLVIGGAIQNVGGSARASGALTQRVISTTDNSVFRENRRIDLFTRKTELPVEFRVSVGSTLIGTPDALFGRAGGPHRALVEFAANEATDFSTQFAVGGEYSYANRFFARAGKRFFNDQRDRGDVGQVGLSTGFGMRIPIFGRSARFDYSYEFAGALDNIQIFSFGVGR